MRIFGGLVMKALTELGLESICAGGYPRDLVLGRAPKDLDIIIYGQKANESEALLRNEFNKAEDNYEAYNSDRINYVIKLGNVDIICYYCNTEQQVFDSFDYNINQYKMEQGKPVFKGENLHTLTEVRGDKSRTVYMQELAKLWSLKTQ